MSGGAVLTTVVMDAMGSLHIWAGSHQVQWAGKYHPLVGGQEADLYLQSDLEVQATLDLLPPALAREVQEGWTAHADLPDEMFPEEDHNG